MAEEKTMTDANDESSGGSSTMMIIGIVIVALILAVAGYFIYQEYTETNAEDVAEDIEDIEEDMEDAADDVEEAVDEIEEEMSEELETEYYRVLALIDTLRAELTEEFYEDLDIIEEYVMDNPEVLLKDDPTVGLPAEISEAYDRVKEGIEDSYAGSEIPEDEVVVGNRYVVTGTLEVAEDKESSFGTVYSLDADELDVDLYFVFGGEVAEEVNETMVGESVEVEVEITEVSDTGVSYKVVNGPTLIEEEE